MGLFSFELSKLFFTWFLVDFLLFSFELKIEINKNSNPEISSLNFFLTKIKKKSPIPKHDYKLSSLLFIKKSTKNYIKVQ